MILWFIFRKRYLERKIKDFGQLKINIVHINLQVKEFIEQKSERN